MGPLSVHGSDGPENAKGEIDLVPRHCLFKLSPG